VVLLVDLVKAVVDMTLVAVEQEVYSLVLDSY
jgi:hypothetical protein